MMHPNTSLEPISSEVGLGVFATEDIPRGSMVWIRDPLDLVVSYAWIERLGPQLQRFLYIDHRGEAILLWDHGRYVNHSCDPNTAGGTSVEVSVALRDISAGEEITEDYRELPWFAAFDCRCGSHQCTRRIEPHGVLARPSPYEPLVARLREAAHFDEWSASMVSLPSDASQTTTLGRTQSCPISRFPRRARLRGLRRGDRA